MWTVYEVARSDRKGSLHVGRDQIAKGPYILAEIRAHCRRGKMWTVYMLAEIRSQRVPTYWPRSEHTGSLHFGRDQIAKGPYFLAEIRSQRVPTFWPRCALSSCLITSPLWWDAPSMAVLAFSNSRWWQLDSWKHSTQEEWDSRQTRSRRQPTRSRVDTHDKGVAVCPKCGMLLHPCFPVLLFSLWCYRIHSMSQVRHPAVRTRR